MKPTSSFVKQIAFTLLLSTLVLRPSTSSAQGLLTPPPGAPAPTMKSLDQIEARTPISSAPFTISTPGSYYLTQNLSVSAGDAITIHSDNVTLDLNGYSINSSASPAAGTGILITGYHANIAIRNGVIKGQVEFSGAGFSGPGFLDGISFTGPDPDNVLVIDLRISSCLDDGIDLGGTDSTGATRCVVFTVGGSGIVAATVDSCAARTCGSAGITAETATNSVGQSRGAAAATGLSAKTASNCQGLSDFGSGLVVTSAANCRGDSNGGGSGLSATTAVNCRGESESASGLAASVADNCYGSSVSGIGLSATTATNSIATSTSGATAMTIAGTASYCRGTRAGGTAINANIAIGCTSGGGTITAAGGKFLGTP
jgi:hypothetical protein